MTLASTTDYETITGTTLDGATETRVAALLAMAESAVLAAAHGQNIASTVYTDVMVRPTNGELYLPQRPVTAVASVATVDSNGTVTTLVANTDYRWEPGGHGRPARIVRRRLGRDSFWGTVANPVGWINGDEAEVKVTYTAGWDPVPASIVGICVAMARDSMTNSGGPAVTAEALGDASLSYDRSALRPAPMGLTVADLSVIEELTCVKKPSGVSIPTGAR